MSNLQLQICMSENALLSPLSVPFIQVKDTHFITVEVRDMNGATKGLFSTATATIHLQDINDNPPTFTKTSVSLLQ